MFKPVLAATLFTLAACATASSPENEAKRLEREAELTFANDIRRGEEVDKICFASQIDGFTNTTDRAVVVREGNDEFLITTRSRCDNLDFANSLAIKSSLSCLRRGDRIAGNQSVFGGNYGGPPSVRCFVDKIYKWDRDAESVEISDAPEEDA
ncbi:MAG: DUF6491 family protein [Pseudomonadota bacterium]